VFLISPPSFFATTPHVWYWPIRRYAPAECDSRCYSIASSSAAPASAADKSAPERLNIVAMVNRYPR